MAAFGEVTTSLHFGREQGGRRAVVACTARSNGGVLAQEISPVPAQHQGHLGFRAAGTATLLFDRNSLNITPMQRLAKIPVESRAFAKETVLHYALA